MDNAISSGKGVVLKKGKNLKYVCAKENKQEKMENFFFQCNNMIGHPFGTAFKLVDKKSLEIIDPILVEDNAEEYEISGCASREDISEDNRLIQDDSNSQKLSKDEIMAYRHDGKPGEEIIEELIENSATFKERTQYSKAKYLKKKKRKYIAQFVALRPSARLLCEMYFSKGPQKIMEMRPDSLAQLLTWSNLHASSKVLLMETCQGLLAGAVMERVTKDGRILQFHQGSSPVRIIAEQFNYSVKDIEDRMCSFPLDKLNLLKQLFQSSLSDDEILEIVIGKAKEENIVQAKSDSETSIAGENKNTNGENNTTLKRSFNGKLKEDKRNSHSQSRVAFINREQRVRECSLAINYLRSQLFDSLIIASKFHPKDLLINLLEFLQPSCPFVVYFTHQEPLMECQVLLREMNIATHVELTECFLRNIQVLPNRTHPDIVMSATGGYLLRGIKINTSD